MDVVPNNARYPLLLQISPAPRSNDLYIPLPQIDVNVHRFIAGGNKDITCINFNNRLNNCTEKN